MYHHFGASGKFLPLARAFRAVGKDFSSGAVAGPRRAPCMMSGQNRSSVHMRIITRGAVKRFFGFRGGSCL
jgi:hypothetical protein